MEREREREIEIKRERESNLKDVAISCFKLTFTAYFARKYLGTEIKSVI